MIPLFEIMKKANNELESRVHFVCGSVWVAYFQMKFENFLWIAARKFFNCQNVEECAAPRDKARMQ